jgi:hypothetical protein
MPCFREGSEIKSEVLMSNTLAVVIGAALVAALFVGATAATTGCVQRGREKYEQGIVPEVVVRAEMPRLVMPTVEVQALRTLAMTGSSFNVN